MRTPVCDFCKKYAEKQSVRLHMPGNKGKIDALDITEIDGADSLYFPNGIIKESMQNASMLFNTAKTLYSTEGSSQVIRAMIYLAKVYSGKNTILALRNAHFSFISACALLGVEIEWLPLSGRLMDANISSDELDCALKKTSDLPMAVYVTSPDYLGHMLDIEGFSKVCKKYGVLLICDNAHGSYLKFTASDMHPITLGADMCADSAHKTLSCLTGGAYLHLSKSVDEYILSESENAMMLFGSTSPSYLILQSLDRLNSVIYENKNAFLQTENLVKTLKVRLSQIGYKQISSEPFKITLDAKDYGYTGFEIYKILKENNIVCEYADSDYVVMMFSVETRVWEFDKILSVFSDIPQKKKINIFPPKIVLPGKVLSVTEAMLSKKKKVAVENASGSILAYGAMTCPPCVLVVVPGEIITENSIQLYKYYGIDSCFIIEK